MHNVETMTEQDIRRLATEAQVDPRTVKKLLAGGVVRQRLVNDRIQAAAKKLKLRLK